MAQDEEGQQSDSASNAQNEGSEAKTSADSHESASTPPATSGANTKKTEPSNSGVIADTLGLWLRMVDGPVEPEFKDGKVTEDNGLLLKLLAFVVVASSTLTGVAAITIKGWTPAALSETLLQSKALLIPFVIVAFTALIYKIVLAPLCKMDIDFPSSVRIFALLGLPYMIFWAALPIIFPASIPVMGRLFYLAQILLIGRILYNIARGINYTTTCKMWKICLSMILPVVIFLCFVVVNLMDRPLDTQPNPPNSAEKQPK